MKTYHLFIATLIILFLAIFFPLYCGKGGWGPTNTITATVLEKHIDTDGDTSHYMIVTDAMNPGIFGGVFEVDNGLFLGVWNADELYGKIQAGRTYTFVTKGKQRENMFMQYYPYITSFKEQ